jgi:hypothetical protein
MLIVAPVLSLAPNNNLLHIKSTHYSTNVLLLSSLLDHNIVNSSKSISLF